MVWAAVDQEFIKVFDVIAKQISSTVEPVRQECEKCIDAGLWKGTYYIMFLTRKAMTINPMYEIAASLAIFAESMSMNTFWLISTAHNLKNQRIHMRLGQHAKPASSSGWYHCMTLSTVASPV